MLKTVHQVPTNGRHGNYLDFSPHAPNLLAVVANDNYAITGCGELGIISTEYIAPDPNSSPCLQFSGRASVFPANDALCSLAWCPASSRNVLTGCRSGQSILWDITKPEGAAQLLTYPGSSKEVSSVTFNAHGDHFVTVSWDGYTLLYDTGRAGPVNAIEKLPTLVYDVRWSPHNANTFVTSAGDGCLRVYENSLRGLVLPCHPSTDILSCDWSATQPHVIAAASTDATVSIWDLRSPVKPLMVLQGHQKAVNRVRFSPHMPFTLATSSYDFTSRVWHSNGTVLNSSCHTEFTVGVSWSTHMPGVLADCSWDGTVALYVT